VHKTLGSAFTLWKSAVEHYNQYRATTLTYCFTKVQFNCRTELRAHVRVVMALLTFVIIYSGWRRWRW
jgi:hypothetical protein